MIESELTKIWQSSPNLERVKFDKSRLMLEVQSSIDQFHRKIKFRDIREQTIALIMMPVFLYVAFTVPYIISKVASVLIVALAVSLVVRLRAAKKYKPAEVTESYLSYLFNTRTYLQHQQRMLESVHLWFLLPSMTFVFLFLFGQFGVPGKSMAILEGSIANVVAHVVVFIIARLDVQRQFTSRLEKVNKLIKVME